MNEKYKKYLPLGSVVLMKEATKRVMVTGYAVKSPESGDRIWDYIGCLWPEGMISSDKNLLFDHKDIGRIFAIGYTDDEQKQFMNVLDKATISREQKENKDNIDKIENIDIFKSYETTKYKFSKDGVIVGINNTNNNDIKASTGGYVFDKNGVIIDVKQDNIGQQNVNDKYKFDSNGIIIGTN